MLWFSFILGLILIFPCFKLFITHIIIYPKTKENKIQTKENNIDHHIYLYMTHGAKKVSQQVIAQKSF